MIEETKVLLRGAIAEAMAKAWDKAAAELLTLLNSSPSTDQPKPKPAQIMQPSLPLSGLTAPARHAEDFAEILEKRYFPELEVQSVTVFTAHEAIQWVEQHVELNEGDLARNPDGRHVWRGRVSDGIGILRRGGKCHAMPGKARAYLLHPPDEQTTVTQP